MVAMESGVTAEEGDKGGVGRSEGGRVRLRKLREEVCLQGGDGGGVCRSEVMKEGWHGEVMGDVMAGEMMV